MQVRYYEKVPEVGCLLRDLTHSNYRSVSDSAIKRTLKSINSYH